MFDMFQTTEVKKNIRKFCGFAFAKNSADYDKRVLVITKYVVHLYSVFVSSVLFLFEKKLSRFESSFHVSDRSKKKKFSIGRSVNGVSSIQFLFLRFFSIFFNFAKRMWADEDVFLGDLFQLQNPLYASGLMGCFWLFFAGTH